MNFLSALTLAARTRPTADKQRLRRSLYGQPVGLPALSQTALRPAMKHTATASEGRLSAFRRRRTQQRAPRAHRASLARALYRPRAHRRRGHARRAARAD